jgi:hypothetical protein
MKIDISTKKYPNTQMMIDRSDWKFLQEIGVRKVSPDQNNGRGTLYAQCFLNKKKVRIHRLLLPESKIVDHINHDGLDNRRKNIRACTVRENLSNLINQGKSKYVGVFKDGKVWRGVIQIKGKSNYLGRFKTELEAANAYQVALSKI